MVTTLSPDRLAELLDGDAEFTLVDTRPEDSYESWHVTGAVHFPFGPEEELDGRLDELEELVGDTDRVITICAKGISSGTLASQLESATDAFEVNAVDGGMKGWSGVYERVEIDIADELVVVQLQRRAKGCLSYLVGCAETGDAIVVDPTADIDEFTAAAAEHELTIVGVVDTHVHADHVSGGRALADKLDVPYYLSDRAEKRGVEIEYTPLERNEVLAVGNRDLKAVPTPGHTSEMIAPLVDEMAVLTADTLHVKSTGRTELEFSEDEGEEGARMLYETLHRTLLAEPDSIVVLPGHVTVTSDGRFEHDQPGDPVTTTIGAARTGIDILELDEESFVDRLADAGEKPANYEQIIDRNRGTLELSPEDRVELELGPNNCSA